MKLKSLLFGSAAVLAAGTGAQAADLPTAEPVEYVRICDAFGTGYYYIPGTDTCLRISGRVRAETHYENGDHFVQPADSTFAPPVGVLPPDVTNFFGGSSYLDQEREFDNWTSSVEGLIELDARTQTDIGLVRTYIAALASIGNGGGFNGDNAPATDYGGSFVLDAAYIQIANDWGTYTAGNLGSRFNFIGSGGINKDGIGVDANDPNTNQFAWTLAGGNGFSATLALEDPYTGGRKRNASAGFASASGGFFGPGGLFAPGGLLAPGFPADTFGSPFPFLTGGFDTYEGQEAPDLVANLRVDQGWGSVQLMGAVRHLHDEEGFEAGFPAGFISTEPTFGDEASDADDIGYAVGAGATLNLPFGGIQASVQGGYSEGAISYVTGDPSSNGYFGGLVTGDFLGPDAENQTEAWNVHGNLQGDLTTSWGWLLAGSYTEVDSAEITVATPGGALGAAFFGPTIVLEGNDYNHWGAIAQLNFSPVEGLTWAFEGGYAEIEYENNAAQQFALSNGATTRDNFDMFRFSTRFERSF